MIGQFSSIGSMGVDQTKWLTGEFQRTMTTLGRSSVRSDPPMLLVRPFRSPPEAPFKNETLMSTEDI